LTTGQLSPQNTTTSVKSRIALRRDICIRGAYLKGKPRLCQKRRRPDRFHNAENPSAGPVLQNFFRRTGFFGALRGIEALLFPLRKIVTRKLKKFDNIFIPAYK
jgi:hypothetical protein